MVGANSTSPAGEKPSFANSMYVVAELSVGAAVTVLLL